MLRRFQTNLTLANAQFGLPASFLPLLFGALFVFVAGQVLLSLPLFKDYRIFFWGENNIIENGQFILFFLGAFQGFLLAWKLHISFEKMYIWGFYALFSSVLFFIGMEEIAWGQQFLHFNSPEFVKSFNMQNEFTLHNVEILQDRTDILNLLFGLGGAAGILLGKIRAFRKISIPPVLGFWVGAIILLGLLGVLFDFISIEKRVDYVFHKQTETVEFLIGAVGLLYVWLNYRYHVGGPSLLQNIQGLRVNFTGFWLQFSNGGEYFLPGSRFSWWSGQSEDILQRGSIQPKRRCVRWETLSKTVCRQEVTRTVPDAESLERAKNASLNRIFFLTGAGAGLVTLVWILTIPGDPKNAVFLGISWVRLGMILVAAGYLALVLALYFKAPWREALGKWVNRGFVSPIKRGIGLVAGTLGIGMSGFLLGAALTNSDPFLSALLNRAAPFALTGAVIGIEWVLLGLQKSRIYGRLSLARAVKVKFSPERMLLVLADEREISFPLESLPAISSLDDLDRNSFDFHHNGLHISWPGRGLSLNVQRAVLGRPTVE